MDKNNLTRHYSNDDITITWQSGICIHAAKCVEALPSVFKPKDRPWIQMENSNTEDIKKAVDLCPSGAISYTVNNAGDPKSDTKADSTTTLNIKTNGPLLTEGPLDIKYDGETTHIEEGKKVALCRCGASSKKPFCDGSHIIAGYKE